MGFYLSKANTFDKIDTEMFKRELMLRGIKCEVRDCNNGAVAVLPAATAALVCAAHKALHERGGSAAVIMTKSLKLEFDATSMEIVRAAYADEDDEDRFQFDGNFSILDRARAAGALLAKQEPDKPVQRMPLATLSDSNFEPVQLDVFVI